MAIVALKKTAWDQATGPQKGVARMLIEQLQLGTPAGGSIGSDDWYVWSDGRITPTFVENMAWVFSHLPDFDDAPVRDYPTTVTETRTVPVKVRVEKTWVDEETGEEYTYYVWEDHPTDTREVTDTFPLGDVYTLAADANLDVAWFTARESLPAAWVPDDGEV